MYTQLYREGTSKKIIVLKSSLRPLLEGKNIPLTCVAGWLLYIATKVSQAQGRFQEGFTCLQGPLCPYPIESIYYCTCTYTAYTYTSKTTKCIGKSTMCPHHKSQGFFSVCLFVCLFVCFSPPQKKKKHRSAICSKDGIRKPSATNGAEEKPNLQSCDKTAGSAKLGF